MKHVAEDIVRGQPHGPVPACTGCPESSGTPETSSTNRTPCTAEQSVVSTESVRHRVFVYGTLKYGQPNHYHFDSWKNSGKCRFVGKARSAVPFPLIVATRWNLPFLLFEPSKGKVRVESFLKISATFEVRVQCGGLSKTDINRHLALNKID
jgi:hypothetical protein